MNLYFAGLHIGWHEVWKKEIPERILLSYHYKTDLLKTISYCKQKNVMHQVNLIIDSGAFSAWSKGIGINIQAYCDCIKEIQDKYQFKTFYAVNLDVIPGKKGCKITKELSYDSMMKGWDNYQWFKKQGIETIHVYHQGEDEEFLLNTIIKECKYIGVSPSNDASSPQKMMWCERIFNLLPEEIKTHGFAVTSLSLIRKFPWYSVDSASWCIGAGMGRINTSFGTLYYSYKGAGDSWCSDNPVLKEVNENALLDEIKSYGIVTFEDESQWQHELKSNHRLRRLINYCYFKRIGQKEIEREKPKKFVDKQLSLF